MANFGDILAVLANNSEDIEELVRRFGGVGNLIKAGPAIFRIMKTVAERHEIPDNVAEKIVQVLYYNDLTADKVRAFQKKHGLKPDGLVGNVTWNKVEELLKGK